MNQTIPPPVTDTEPKPGSRAKRASPRYVPPPLWAKAFTLYVLGELPHISAVVRYLGITRNSVARRMDREQWTKAREQHAQRVRDRVKDHEGLEVVGERLEKERLELAQVQSTLARSVLAHASALVSELSASAPLMEQAIARTVADPGPGTAEALRALSGYRTETAETLRVLAGIPHPDRSRRPLPEDKPSEDKPRALRVEDVSPISTGSGSETGESAGGGGEGGGGA